MMGTGPLVSHFRPVVFSLEICGLSGSSKYHVVPLLNVNSNLKRTDLVGQTWDVFHHPILPNAETHLCSDWRDVLISDAFSDRGYCQECLAT
jgi:hypothetical protein